MRSDTNFFARDGQGVKLVVGQTVYSTHHKRTGQLLGVVHPQQICTVRFVDTGEVVNIAAAQLKIATWNEIRKDDCTTAIRQNPAKSAQPDKPKGD
jgi:hypothetical protein